MKKLLLIHLILLFNPIFSQQKTFCNPINIDYGYTPFEVFSKQGKHRATADPVIVNFQKKLFHFLPTRKVIGILTICWIGNSSTENFF
jgi:hypothetical protein